jgi:hypothetical protein
LSGSGGIIFKLLSLLCGIGVSHSIIFSFDAAFMMYKTNLQFYYFSLLPEDNIPETRFFCKAWLKALSDSAKAASLLLRSP